MRVFKNAWFGRFVRKEKIAADVLWDAVERAERGLIDADLGGGVIKQRIARPGAGKSKGYRTILIFRKGDKAFLCMAFLKVSLATLRTMNLNSSKTLPSPSLQCPRIRFVN